jgi:hypothetical protein
MTRAENTDPAEIDNHLARMRVTAVAALFLVMAAAVAAFAMHYRGSEVASPMTVTLVAVAGTLWVGFTATRDADRRLEVIRRAFAVHGEEEKLLREYWIVYLAVVVRLSVMVLAGVMVALFGLGPRVGIWLILLGGLMIALTWPTRRKIQLLLGRSRALREM